MGPLQPRQWRMGGGGAVAVAAPFSALPSQSLELGRAEGLAAVVVKPSVVGGLDATWRIVQWAAAQGVRVVVSSAFESSAGIALLAQLAAAVDVRMAAGGPAQTQPAWQATHGLGTLGWFGSDVVQRPLLPAAPALQQQQQQQGPAASRAASGCSVGAADSLLSGLAASMAARAGGEHGGSNTAAAVGSNGAVAPTPCCQLEASTGALEQRLEVSSSTGATYRFRALHLPCSTPSTSGASSSQNGSSGSSNSGAAAQPPVTLVFLHGFMGSAEDWIPLMEGLQPLASCLAVDLPGHGGTTTSPPPPPGAPGGTGDDPCSLAATADALAVALQQHQQQLPGSRLVLVGYSLGARLAMQLLTSHPHLFAAGVVVSGTAGLRDAAARAARVQADAETAQLLDQLGLQAFLDHWYSQPLWDSLRAHPRYAAVLARRAAAAGEEGAAEARLAEALNCMSTGRMVSWWWLRGRPCGTSM